MTLWLGILSAIVVLEALLIAGLLRSHALILKRLHDLGAGIGDPSGRGDGHDRTGVRSEVAFRTPPGVPAPRRDVGFADAVDITGVGVDGADVGDGRRPRDSAGVPLQRLSHLRDVLRGVRRS